MHNTLGALSMENFLSAATCLRHLSQTYDSSNGSFSK